jgi:hypothetical protein
LVCVDIYKYITSMPDPNPGDMKRQTMSIRRVGNTIKVLEEFLVGRVKGCPRWVFCCVGHCVCENLDRFQEYERGVRGTREVYFGKDLGLGGYMG